jgi:hypothetical protein
MWMISHREAVHFTRSSVGTAAPLIIASPLQLSAAEGENCNNGSTASTVAFSLCGSRRARHLELPPPHASPFPALSTEVQRIAPVLSRERESS